MRGSALTRSPVIGIRCLVRWFRRALSNPRANALLLLAIGASLLASPPHPSRSRLPPTPATFPSSTEGQRPDPSDFSPEELRSLNQRFGVHGPQPRLAQLFTEGLDQLKPLRAQTFGRIEELKPVILTESDRHGINPMLVAAVLFDELQHAKPGEDLPIAARSGLFKTLGPAQLSVGEMEKQGLLSAQPTSEEIYEARQRLLDPDHNVELLVGKFARLSRDLGFPRDRMLMASGSSWDAKAIATLAYLHNGKLDYPARVLRYMQDPELHAVIYGTRRAETSPLI